LIPTAETAAAVDNNNNNKSGRSQENKSISKD
jgi:hypothetical protein